MSGTTAAAADLEAALPTTRLARLLARPLLLVWLLVARNSLAGLVLPCDSTLARTTPRTTTPLGVSVSSIVGTSTILTRRHAFRITIRRARSSTGLLLPEPRDSILTLLSSLNRRLCTIRLLLIFDKRLSFAEIAPTAAQIPVGTAMLRSLGCPGPLVCHHSPRRLRLSFCAPFRPLAATPDIPRLLPPGHRVIPTGS